MIPLWFQRLNLSYHTRILQFVPIMTVLASETVAVIFLTLLTELMTEKLQSKFVVAQNNKPTKFLHFLLIRWDLKKDITIIFLFSAV